MRSSDGRELPPGWRPRSVGVELLAIGAPIGVLLLARPVLALFGSGAWVGGVAAVTGFAVVLIGAWGALRHRWRTPGSNAVEADEKAGVTRIRYSREVVGLRLTALVGTAACLASLGTLAATAGVLAAAVVSFGLCAACLGWLLWWLAGIRAGELTLDPLRVRLRHNRRDLVLGWNDVISVYPWDSARAGALWRRIDLTARDAGHVRGWRQPGRHEWLFDPRTRLPSIEIRCDLIDLDSVALLRMLTFYLEHADARGELGTSASLVRARSGDLAH